MGKWDREYTARQDRQQTVFMNGQIMLKPKSTATVTMLKNTAMCPFCLHLDSVDRFVLSTKKGFHKGLGECPQCKSKAQFKSLLKKWTPEEFAEWVYGYRADGFWQKINFQRFKEGLKRLGWTEPFWLRYNMLKGEINEGESYTDFLDRKQREEALEKGWTETQDYGEEE